MLLRCGDVAGLLTWTRLRKERRYYAGTCVTNHKVATGTWNGMHRVVRLGFWNAIKTWRFALPPKGSWPFSLAAAEVQLRRTFFGAVNVMETLEQTMRNSRSPYPEGMHDHVEVTTGTLDQIKRCKRSSLVWSLSGRCGHWALLRTGVDDLGTRNRTMRLHGPQRLIHPIWKDVENS
jgi:hypothetical protein